MTTIQNHQSTANQAVHQAIHGDVHFHSLKTSKVEEREACLRSLFLVDPKQNKDTLKSRKGSRARGTCEWFVETDEFKDWLNGTTSSMNVFWLFGHPGTGKSTLSIYLVEWLEKEFATDDGKALAYFFCDATSSIQNTAIAILRGLVFQLSQKHPSLVDKHLLPEFRIKDNKIFSSFDALWSIFSAMALDQDTGNKYLVIDALDECDLESQNLLLRQLEESFGRACPQDSPAFVRFLITSRPYPEIEFFLQDFPNRNMTSFDQVSRDVEAMITEKVARLAQKKRYTPKLQKHVADTLRAKAEGTFLWVGLACAELERLPVKTGIDLLNGLPAGLDSIYGSLLQHAFDDAVALGEEADTVIRVLRVVSVALTPLTVTELAIACQLHIQDDIENAERKLFMQNTIDMCRLMVVVDDQYVRLLHKSVKDFLYSSATEHFHTPLQAHAQLAHCCLDRILEDHRKQPIGEDFRKTDCFLEYSARYWPEHARLAEEHYQMQYHQRTFFTPVSSSRDWWLNIKLALGDGIPPHFTLYHVAAAWDLLPLLEHAESHEFLNATSGEQKSPMLRFSAQFERFRGNPLWYAIHAGRIKAFRRLLQFGVHEAEDKLLLTETTKERIEADTGSAGSFYFSVTLDMVKSVVHDTTSGYELTTAILELRGADHFSEEEVLIGAVKNQKCGQRIVLALIEHCNDQIQFSDNVLMHAISNLDIDNPTIELIFDFLTGERAMSPEVAVRLIEHRDPSLIDRMLGLYGQNIWFDAIIMGALLWNDFGPQAALRILLEHVPRERIIMTEQLILDLLQHFDLALITRIVNLDLLEYTDTTLSHIVQNRISGPLLTETILRLRPDINVSAAVMIRAAENPVHSVKIVELLLRHAPEQIIPATALIRAVINANGDVFGVTTILSANHHRLAPDMDEVFQTFTYRCTQHDDLINIENARDSMIALLTGSTFIFEPTYHVITAAAVTSVPEEVLLSWLMTEEKMLLGAEDADWSLLAEKLSKDAILAVIERSANKQSAAVEAAKVAVEHDNLDLMESLLLQVPAERLYGTELAPVLCEAVSYGSLSIFQALLRRGVSIKETCLRYGSLMKSAVSTGNVKIVQTLLDSGIDVTASDNTYENLIGATLTPIPDRDNFVLIARLLLDQRIDLNACNSERLNTLLHDAALTGNCRIAGMLLEAGADINAVGGHYGYPLQAAVCASSQSLEMTRLLLSSGANPRLRGGVHGDVLVAALSLGRPHIAYLLFRNGAHISPGLVKRLLSQISGAQISISSLSLALRLTDHVQAADNTSSTSLLRALEASLHVAVRASGFWGRSDLCQILYEAGADVSARSRADRTVLIEASALGQRESVKWLLSMGASVYDVDDLGCTPLHYAVQVDVAIAEMLLDAGADITALDGDGCSVLHRASASGNLETLEWSMSELARVQGIIASQDYVSTFVNHVDNIGRTALHLALYCSDMETVEFLTMNGAYTDIPDNHGITLELWLSMDPSDKEMICQLPTSHIKTTTELLEDESVDGPKGLQMLQEIVGMASSSDYAELAEFLFARGYSVDAVTAWEQLILPFMTDPGSILHASTPCKGCHAGSILGTRYKCQTCYDCDLCHSCWISREPGSCPECCLPHKEGFISIPGPFWKGVDSKIVNDRGETRDQWLERLITYFVWTKFNRQTTDHQSSEHVSSRMKDLGILGKAFVE